MQKNELDGLMRDNDVAYLMFVERIIKTIDYNAAITARRQLSAISFHIRPSNPMLKQPILKALLRGHTSIQIRVELAKTITTSPYINFSVACCL